MSILPCVGIYFLLENGLELKEIKYEHNKLKTPLHWAFYCNNQLAFADLLKRGCEIVLNDDIFYNKEHKKNFEFALFLYLFKEKIKYKDEHLYEIIVFDDSDCLCTDFKLYEYFNEEQIIEIFEQLTNIGFDINEENIFPLHYIRWSKYNSSQFDIFNCSQLLPCICQTGITPKLIKYFIHKYFMFKLKI